MTYRSRREFLGDVGKGMLIAGIGSTLASELQLANAETIGAELPLTFGKLEPLVALMQDTAPDKLTELLVARLHAGTTLRELVAAGALANARTFGGQDYVGFHTFMALAPAYRMSQALPDSQKPLPVLKVLYRNANRIQEFGGRKSEILHEIEAADLPPGTDDPGTFIREAARTGDVDQADRALAAFADAPIGEAFNHVQFAVEDEVDVHRVVLAWRAWDTLDLAGEEWAHCLLRQSVRYCADVESRMIERNYPRSPVRDVLPKLLDQYKLLEKPLGTRTGDDAWTDQLASVMFRGAREEAAEAAADALAEGFAPDAVAEAMALAANRLVLHDPGRPEEWSNNDKPVGSCHGDSVGVHASDAANAWRNIARVSNNRNAIASMIVGAFHTAGQSDRSNEAAYPTQDQLERVQAITSAELLRETDAAIREQNQFGAVAAVSRYGSLGFEPQPLFNLLLQYATSEDGALHAEKYYNTAFAEFADMRPSLRWGQLAALARVTASEYGKPAPGFALAKDLLNA